MRGNTGYNWTHKAIEPITKKELGDKAGEWKQGFLVVPAVDVFKPETIKETLEWFNKNQGRN